MFQYLYVLISILGPIYHYVHHKCHSHFPLFVQVLHPGIRRQVQIDLILMKAGSLLISCLPGIKWLSLPEVVDEFEKLMTKQVILNKSKQVCLAITGNHDISFDVYTF